VKGRASLPKASPLEHKSRALNFNDRISMDLIIKLAEFYNVFVVMDDYSRYVKAECLPHRDAHSVLDSYTRLWQAEFHNPRRVRHDIDPSYVQLDQHFKTNGVKREEVPPYTPHLVRQQERVHQTLEQMFSAVMLWPAINPQSGQTGV